MANKNLFASKPIVGSTTDYRFNLPISSEDVGGATEESEITAALMATTEKGIKVWEQLALDKALAKTEVIASVSETWTDGKPSSVVTTGTAGAKDTDLASLASGTYRKAYEVSDVDGDTVTIADPDEPTVAVVRKRVGGNETLILPVPGTSPFDDNTDGKLLICVKNIFRTGLLKNDVATYYADDGVKRQWKFDGNEWKCEGTIRDGKLNEMEACDCKMPAGGALWLTRTDSAAGEVVLVTRADATQMTFVAGEWNIAANPDPLAEVSLDDVVKDAGVGDSIIIPMPNGAQKSVKFADGHWTYKHTSVDANGNLVVTREPAKLSGAQGFWYIKSASSGAWIKWK